MIKKLLKAYKDLPAEVRMLLAMAGLGTPFGAIWLLKTYLFPNTPMVYLIIGVALVMGALAFVGWLFVKLFGFGKKKRSAKLADELAKQEGGGPVSMDVRAAIKGNNEKFFSAIREMRKNLNVNVYDLPWYIVMGDSGCGKTKLVNEGGLTFSTGKPEGYQLGTLNYNWWFTEDAIFIDMAGRLCNPQDDADHREWSAFLDTVGKGRKGYPINGAVVCVSAEHLLQDAPEKHEQDANTALERLRELQTRLGVTFATYLVVTKCDKILGFMQFFDRAERDISYRNQVFGWSKPGNFNELYDPENFKGDFDALYTRLNELRIRRLNDDVEEHELGLAYSFPEEFRELRDPLMTYVRALFPMIKQARVVKNLIFRGVYFTSATQQGSVILKHLSERLGNDAAQNFPPLESLYPRPRTHFIKDLFFRKVFKEYGLVFRNEQEAERNRKLAKMFRIASVAVSVVVVATLVYGFTRFDGLIGKARAMVIEAQDNKGQKSPSRVVAASSAETEALRTCLEMKTHQRNLEDHPWAARLLSLFWDSGQPAADLETIRTGLFQEGVLRKALKRVEVSLSSMELGRFGDPDPKVRDRAQRFAESLNEYLYLVSFKDRPEERPELTQDRLVRLFSIIKEKDALGDDIVLEVKWSSFVEELADYITGAAASAYLNPSRVLSDRNFEPEQTVAAAMETYRKYLEPLAALNEDHPDSVVRQWMRIRKACADAMADYGKMLELTSRQVHNRGQLLELKNDFASRFKTFSTALDQCNWQVAADDTGRKSGKVESLSSAIQRIQEEWLKTHLMFYRTYTRRNPDGTLASGASAVASPMESADGAASGAVLQPPELKNLSPVIISAINGFVYRKNDESRQEEGLSETLRRNLVAMNLLDVDKLDQAESEKKGPIEIQKFIREVAAVHAYMILGKRRSTDPPDVIREIELTPDALLVRSSLEKVKGLLDNLAGETQASSETLSLDEWVQRIAGFAEEVSTADAEAAPELAITADYRTLWAADKLAEFMKYQRVLIARGKLTESIESVTQSLTASSTGERWGLAELFPGFNKAAASFYSIGIPQAVEVVAPSVAPDMSAPVPASTGPKRFSNLGGRRTAGAGSRTPVRSSAHVRDQLHTETIPTCATRTFLLDSFGSAGGLTNLTLQIPTEYCLAEEGADPIKGLADAMAQSKRVYLDHYFAGWDNAYKKAEFKALDRITATNNWTNLRVVMKNFQNDVGRQLANATSEILENVSWADFRWDGDEWTDDRILLTESRSTAWKQTRFQREVVDMPGLDREVPWASVAERIERGWADFAKSVGNYKELPTDFTEPGQPQAERINWAVVDEEISHRLADLKYVEVVMKSAEHCRTACDREVQGCLLKIQRGYKFSGEGLPYLSGKEIETVEPKNFSRFTRQVIIAESLLQPLDQTLEGYKVRLPFYRLCREWDDFIAPGDTDPYNKPLSVTITMDPEYASGQHLGVTWIDAKDASLWSSGSPVTGAANFYSKSELWLGLATPDNQDPVTLPLTAEAGVVNATWNWPAEGRYTYMATIKLSGKGRQIYKRDWPEVSIGECGKVDELLLPALLERLGKSDENRRVWRIGVRWDLKTLYNANNAADAAGDMDRLTQLSADDKIVGTKFEFTLDRKLPEPIRCLSEMAP